MFIAGGGDILCSHSVALGLILGVPENFDVTEIYRWHWLDESGQSFDNVDRN